MFRIGYMVEKEMVSVAVCVMTYNHERYISQTLDGILMQKTNFPVTIFIGEDCSTDSTRQICLEYQNANPEQIVLLPNEPNMGLRKNFARTFAAAKGKYLAICEGDDYWIDPLKLQKQVDFLEQNTEYAMSSHNIDTLWFGIEIKKNEPLSRNEFTIKEIILDDWFIMTASLVFRSEGFRIPENLCTVNNMDYIIQLLVALNGKIHYMPESMAVYRKHQEGMSLQFTPLFLSISLTELFDAFNKYTAGKYKKIINKKLTSLYGGNAKQAKKIGHRKHALFLKVAYVLMHLHINIVRPLVNRPNIYKRERFKF